MSQTRLGDGAGRWAMLEEMTRSRSDSSQAGTLAAALVVLDELRAEIADTLGLDAERRERVLTEIAEIRAHLRSVSPPREASVLDRVEQLALDFEASHPAAADLVSRLSTLLAGMGI